MSRLPLIPTLGSIFLSCTGQDLQPPDISSGPVYFKPDSGYIPGMIFVGFHPGTTPKQIKSLLDSLDLKLEGGPYGEFLSCNVIVPVGREDESAQRLRAQPIVKTAGRGVMSHPQIEYR